MSNTLEKNCKTYLYRVGIIFLPIGITLIGLGIDLLFNKCCQFLFIGLGIGLITDGIIFLKTYRYLNANKNKNKKEDQ
jgi:hypothetical protein